MDLRPERRCLECALTRMAIGLLVQDRVALDSSPFWRPTFASPLESDIFLAAVDT